jgi:hypothetical protein
MLQGQDASSLIEKLPEDAQNYVNSLVKSGQTLSESINTWAVKTLESFGFHSDNGSSSESNATNSFSESESKFVKDGFSNASNAVKFVAEKSAPTELTPWKVVSQSGSKFVKDGFSNASNAVKRVAEKFAEKADPVARSVFTTSIDNGVANDQYFNPWAPQN